MKSPNTTSTDKLGSELQDDILLIDKPAGITSFDVIRRLRKELGIKKMGHAGTLDPLATGLIIIGVGKGTKKLKNFVGLPKTYHAEILLGKKTTTGDLEGEVTESAEVNEVDLEKVNEILMKITGKITLPVPTYSAVKIEGQPLYKRARKGEKVKPPDKVMEIKSIKLLDHFNEDEGYVLKVEMEVGSGTYVRSIAEEVGRQLGVPATSKLIRRTKIGDYSVDMSRKLETNDH